MLLSKERLRVGAAGLTFALFASACAGTPTEETSAAAPDTTAAVTEETEAPAPAGGAGLPVLVADSVAGPQIDTNDLAGQDVVVWFWAPW